MHSETEDGADVLDVSRVGPSQVLLLAVGALVLLSDGFDAQVLSVAGPSLAGAWHLSKGALAPVFAANLAGLMVGALLITPLTDLFSRKRVIAGCLVAFGTAVPAHPLDHGASAELELLRFVTGLALGAAMPSAIAAASEYVPRRHRTAIVVGLSCSFSLGSALSGIVASICASPASAGPACSSSAASSRLLTLPLLLACFPESPTFLLARGRRALSWTCLAAPHGAAAAGPASSGRRATGPAALPGRGPVPGVGARRRRSACG